MIETNLPAAAATPMKICAKDGGDGNQFSRAALNSCGAAMRRWPTASAVGFEQWNSEPRSGERKSSWTAILSPLAGLLAMAHCSPRLTPWATFLRHSVADNSRANFPNSDLRPHGRRIRGNFSPVSAATPTIWRISETCSRHRAKRGSSRGGRRGSPVERQRL